MKTILECSSTDPQQAIGKRKHYNACSWCSFLRSLQYHMRVQRKS